MRFTLLLPALLLAACSGSVPSADTDGPYAGIPRADTEGPVAMAQPVIPTGDPALDEFLAELAAAIDRHDWRGVAARMDPGAFVEQRALLDADGSDEPAAQLIAETLGLGRLYHDAPGWSGLESIRVVTFRQHGVQTPGIAGGEAYDLIDGTVRLENGQTLPLSFTIAQRGGAHVVLVPLG